MQSRMVVEQGSINATSKSHNLLGGSFSNSWSDGAEPEVVKSSGACHKRFRTLAQAEAFIADWVEMYACMVKAKIKEELLDGYRSAKMKGLAVELTLRTGSSNEEDQLTDGLGKLRVE